MYTKSRQGWTLIELLIVLVIVAVLATIALPNIRELGQPSNRYHVQAHLLSLARQLEHGYNQTKKYQSIPTLDFPTDNSLYTISVNIFANDQKFTLTAIPIAGQENDGALELDSDGNKKHYSSDQPRGSFVSW